MANFNQRLIRCLFIAHWQFRFAKADYLFDLLAKAGTLANYFVNEFEV